MSLEYTNAQY